MKPQEARSIWAATCQIISEYDWLILLLLLPLVIFSSPFTAAPLLIIPLLWIARRLATGRFVISTPADWTILLLSIMLLISLYATFDLAFSAPRVAAILYGIAIFYSAAAFAGRSQQRLLWGVTLLLLCGLIVAIFSLLGTQWTDKLPLLAAITGHLPQIVRFKAAPAGFSPNQVAGTLLWVLPLAIALTLSGLSEIRFLHRGTVFSRWVVLLVGVGSLVLLGTFLLTQSRSGFAGLAAALLFMLFAARSWRPATLVAGLVALLLSAVGLWLLAFSDWPVRPFHSPGSATRSRSYFPWS